MHITYNNLIRFSGALNAPRMAVPKGVRGISLVRQMKLSLQRWGMEKGGRRERERRRGGEEKKRKDIVNSTLEFRGIIEFVDFRSTIVN